MAGIFEFEIIVPPSPVAARVDNHWGAAIQVEHSRGGTVLLNQAVAAAGSSSWLSSVQAGDKIRISEYTAGAFKQWLNIVSGHGPYYQSGGIFQLNQIPETSDWCNGTAVPDYAWRGFFAKAAGSNLGDVQLAPGFSGWTNMENLTSAGIAPFIGMFARTTLITSLPEGSFRTNNLKTYTGIINWPKEGSYYPGNNAFVFFNWQGSLEHLPMDSFHFPDQLAGEYSGFCAGFNEEGALVALPRGSFNPTGPLYSTAGRTPPYAQFNLNGSLPQRSGGVSIRNISPHTVPFDYSDASSVNVLMGEYAPGFAEDIVPVYWDDKEVFSIYWDSNPVQYAYWNDKLIFKDANITP